jgi:hypothetical protein
VANDVRDSVSLSGARWALNNETVRLLQAANDFNLFVVERLGKKQVAMIRINRDVIFIQFNMIGCAKAIPERLECIIDAVGRT